MTGEPPIEHERIDPEISGALLEVSECLNHEKRQLEPDGTHSRGRPADLEGEDLAFIRAAAGRSEHPDPRLPVVG